MRHQLDRSTGLRGFRVIGGPLPFHVRHRVQTTDGRPLGGTITFSEPTADFCVCGQPNWHHDLYYCTEDGKFVPDLTRR